MARPPMIEDLRKPGENEGRFHISMTLALIVGATLASSGIIIALVLPELFADKGTVAEGGNGELAVLMTLTMDEVIVGNYNLSNAPFQEVLMLLLDGGMSVTELEGPVREFGREMITTLVGEGTPYRLRAYTGSVQGAPWEMVSQVPLPSGIDPTLQTVDMPISHLGIGLGPMTVTLEIWERGSS